MIKVDFFFIFCCAHTVTVRRSAYVHLISVNHNLRFDTKGSVPDVPLSFLLFVIPVKVVISNLVISGREAPPAVLTLLMRRQD